MSKLVLGLTCANGNDRAAILEYIWGISVMMLKKLKCISIIFERWYRAGSCNPSSLKTMTHSSDNADAPATQKAVIFRFQQQ